MQRIAAAFQWALIVASLALGIFLFAKFKNTWRMIGEIHSAVVKTK